MGVNFTTILAGLGVSGQAFNPNSIRVVEVNPLGELIDPADPLVPAQFDPGTNYNATSNATGALIFLLEGMTGAETMSATGGSTKALPAACSKPTIRSSSPTARRAK